MKAIYSVFLLAFSASVVAADGGVLGGVTGGAEAQTAGGVQDLTAESLERTNQPMVIKSLNATQATFDDSDPDANTIIMPYSKTATYKARVREFMGTMIILPEGDAIETYKLGDEVNFTFKVADGEQPRTGTADVKLPGSDTALNIVGTSGNIYTFYLRGDTWDSPHDPTLKFYIEDEQLGLKLKAIEQREKAREQAELSENVKASITPSAEKPTQEDYLEEVEFTPESLDFDYKIVGGDESIRPFAVYSDGQFTYFRFGERDETAAVREMPVVYRVADGSDIPTNSTAKKGTLRVEGVHNKWTLRLGNKHLCIEKMIPLPANKTRMNTFVDGEVKG
jgi:type IV secretory pathway VirB9-like protein